MMALLLRELRDAILKKSMAAVTFFTIHSRRMRMPSSPICQPGSFAINCSASCFGTGGTPPWHGWHFFGSQLFYTYGIH